MAGDGLVTVSLLKSIMLKNVIQMNGATQPKLPSSTIAGHPKNCL
jgi:hypothetical protein